MATRKVILLVDVPASHEGRLVDPAGVVQLLRVEDFPVCRVCECSDFEACMFGCSWVEPDLCSSCTTVVDDEPTHDTAAATR